MFSSLGLLDILRRNGVQSARGVQSDIRRFFTPVLRNNPGSSSTNHHGRPSSSEQHFAGEPSPFCFPGAGAPASSGEPRSSQILEALLRSHHFAAPPPDPSSAAMPGSWFAETWISGARHCPLCRSRTSNFVQHCAIQHPGCREREGRLDCGVVFENRVSFLLMKYS
jgi:hypothetical protein